jgi:hypothetical protein
MADTTGPDEPTGLVFDDKAAHASAAFAPGLETFATGIGSWWSWTLIADRLRSGM